MLKKRTRQLLNRAKAYKGADDRKFVAQYHKNLRNKVGPKKARSMLASGYPS